MAEPLIEMKRVSKHYSERTALADINLKVASGERVALVGPSGAGKTTLINLLNGSLLPDEGEVLVFGHNMARISSRQLRQVQGQIGTVYQQFHLVKNLRVIHNVNAGNLARWSTLKALLSLMRPLEAAKAEKALERVGIPDKLYERTDRLSGGEQQRVALARILIQNPRIVLADEPIASLDPARALQTMDLLSELAIERGNALVVSLHAIEYAYSHCDRIVGIRDGRTQFDTTPDNVDAKTVRSLYDLRKH